MPQFWLWALGVKTIDWLAYLSLTVSLIILWTFMGSDACHTFELGSLSHCFYRRSMRKLCCWFVHAGCNLYPKVSFLWRWKNLWILVNDNAWILSFRHIETLLWNWLVLTWNLWELSCVFLWYWISISHMIRVLILCGYYSFPNALHVTHALQLHPIL
jgi:hypothetical protein